MKKLKLNLEDLKIETFQTTKSKVSNKGTVAGHDIPTRPICEVSLHGTCRISECTCDPTCAFSCPNTCDFYCTQYCSENCTNVTQPC